MTGGDHGVGLSQQDGMEFRRKVRYQRVAIQLQVEKTKHIRIA